MHVNKVTVALLLGGMTVLAAGAYAYTNNINALRFGLVDIRVTEKGNIGVVIAVSNPSEIFGYPVPELHLNVFDQGGNFLGHLINDQLQWIAAGGTSFVYAWVQPNYMQLATVISNLLLQPQNDFLLKGIVKVADTGIPIQTALSIKN